MKKSIIWLLTIVMGITFCALLYFQITYLENMVKMRESQFTENAMHSIYGTVGVLERRETMHFLQEDIRMLSQTYDDTDEASLNELLSSEELFPIPQNNKNQVITYPHPTEKIEKRYLDLQNTIWEQYIYQRGLLNEVILSILYDGARRPVLERADSDTIRKVLSIELANNGLDVPFSFAITDNNTIVFSTDDYNPDLNEKQIYSARLFPNSNSRYELKVEFPTKANYIYSSVRFVIPTLALSILLLAIFIFTMILAFRQKKLGEMKTDFINNMTHELKTPISTISLAAQMLNDDSVRKSPETLHHISEVINAESKRLRFQVEKVLQMSVFDNSTRALNFTIVDANKIIASVVSTFKLKVERFGGSLSFINDADEAMVRVDEMQFTNVIFNLLDNAVKYRNEDVEPELSVTTADASNHMLRISIKDNGIGMRKEDLKKIFEKFYRVHTGNRHDVKGFGLGLAYVHRMVNVFGGNITVESELGKGSEFTILLPLADPEKEND
ncbi:MAG: HAMP domain-containing histidine kinase [Muribaculaceae bacterium]|nr:HAMP domain-containing histidine kinase [Muribaculaceae bacterium]